MIDLYHDTIRASPRPECILCGSPGKPLYQGLEDRLFGAAGTWTMDACTNPECGLLWLNPMPLKEDMGKAYLTYYTHDRYDPPATLFNRIYWALRDGYLQSGYGYRHGVGPRWFRYLAPLAHFYPAGAARFAAAAMFLHAPPPGARLLEIGCGSGAMLSRMQELGWEVEGIETDPQAVESAKAAGLHVRLGELGAQAYPDSCFDAVYMSHVIEHVHDPVELFAECCRLMKPGGTLVVLTPNTESLGHRRFGESWRGIEPPRHLHLFNRICMRRTVERAGYTVARLCTLAKSADYILSMSAKIARARSSGQRVEDRKQTIEGVMYQIGERLALLRDDRAGEEILVMANKPYGDG